MIGMRVRNPKTGTIVNVGDETGTRLTATGWERADSPPASRKSTTDTSSAGDESTDTDSDTASETRKPRRRTRRS